VAIAIAGAFRLTKASVLVAIRSKLSHWSELLWSRTLAEKVMQETLTIDHVFPPAPAPQPNFVRDVAAKVKETVTPPPRQPAHP
jgi:hypothetical protein